ncbi:MAG: hypothetical protein GWP59_02120 [Chlamydiales bacterium]|nr:hypothetical protein [Chlamydiales bacterium]
MTLDIERKALYNLLRMNWLNEPDMQVEKWQVLDYRSLSTQKLFSMLFDLEVELDEELFYLYAKDMSCPEDMAAFLETDEDTASWQDQLYLVIFELWRRLLPEKQSFSIFCDELDYQINYYDQQSNNQEEIQDLFANLQQLLEDTTDSGESPEEVFAALQRFCGNNIESFLSDFITEQIDEDNLSYAQELIDGFQPFLPKSLWLELFAIRIQSHISHEDALHSLKAYIKKLQKLPSLDLYFEVLNHMVQNSEPNLFSQVIKQVLPLLEKEEDFQELLEICLDYFKVTDQEEQELAIDSLIESRLSKDITLEFSANDPGIKELLKVIKISTSIN